MSCHPQVESRLPVGTPEYIAPEVLTTLDSSADYGVCCDWWSLGIIAYELLYDVTPFEGDSTAKTYSNIMNYKASTNGVLLNRFILPAEFAGFPFKIPQVGRGVGQEVVNHLSLCYLL